MDKNTNKVYINPNFKRSLDLRAHGTDYSDRTYINRHYKEHYTEQPHIVTDTILNRKIYVNPNFMPINTVSSIKENMGRPIKSENIMPTLNCVHKSKYSLVNNVKLHRTHNQITDVNNDNKIEKIELRQQNLHDSSKEIPLKRSRYCIVRKKKQSFNSADLIPSNNLTSHSSNNTRRLHTMDSLNTIQTKMKPTEKVIKIKISKYKSIPLSDLSKNIASKTSLLHSKSLETPNFTKFGKNQFKYLKPSITPEKLAVKPTLKLNLTKSKQVCAHDGKTKILKGNYKVNNIPCRLFIKYGKCLRMAYGNCNYLHDRKHVSLCRKFLKGLCHDKDCSLSHELTAKKMPTCYFYLKGMCTKENCPYLHIKLSDKINICQDFLKGYCENGDKCAFRHMKRNNIKKSRKDFKETQNKTNVTKQITLKSTIKKENYNKNINREPAASEVDCRYYKETVNNVVNCETIKPSRCKLGTLPSYIQL